MALTQDLAAADAILEYSYTVGTGTYALAGAWSTHEPLSARYTTGATVIYRVTDGSSGVGAQFEVGTGTYNATAKTLTRSVLASSNANALVNWSGRTRLMVRPLLGTMVPPGASGLPLCPTAPTNGQILVFNAALGVSGEWCPADLCALVEACLATPTITCGAVFLEGDGFGYDFPTMTDSPVFSLSFWVYLTGSQLYAPQYHSTPPATGDLFTKNIAYVINDPGISTGETFISVGGAKCSASFDITNVTRANPAVITTSSPHGVAAGSYFGFWDAGYANGTSGGNWPLPQIAGYTGSGSPAGGLMAVSVTSDTITTNWDTSAAPNAWVTPTDTGGAGQFASYQIYNSLQVFLSDSGGDFIQWFTGTRIPSDQWVNVLISCDTGHASGSKIINVFFGDTQVFPSSTVVDASGSFNIQFGDAQSSGNYWNIFGTYSNPGDGGVQAYVAETWFAAGQFIDFTNPTERAKFHNGSNKPVSLGTTGSLPTGTAPTFYLTLTAVDTNPTDFFLNAAGTGALQNGDYVGVGGMEIAPTSPCS